MRNDIDLINSSIDGNQEAFAGLFDLYARSVYLLAYRYVLNVDDAEDVAQEAFFRAWKNLKKFDVSKNFKTWLFVIAKNTALDLIKKKKPASFSQFTDDDDVLEAYLSSFTESPVLPDAIFDRKAVQANLDDTIAKLPHAYRAVIRMRYNDQLKFGEIAEMLGEPVGTIRSKHHRALVLLREFLIG